MDQKGTPTSDRSPFGNADHEDHEDQRDARHSFGEPEDDERGTRLRRRATLVASVVAVAAVIGVVVILSAGGRAAPRAQVAPKAWPEVTPSALALRTWPRKVPVGGPMFWEGAVLGSTSAHVVLAQVKRGESWETFETLPVSGSGHYCLEYHFLRATHPTRYTFRAYFPRAASRDTGAVESNEVQVVVGEGARLRRRALIARLRHMRAYCPRTIGPAGWD